MFDYPIQFEDELEERCFRKFITGYVEALVWTECNSDKEDEGLDDKTSSDFSDEMRRKILADCRKFYCKNDVALTAAYTDRDRPYDYLGHDFWLTRCGHGTGFWDRGMGTLGDQLTDAAQQFSEYPHLWVNEETGEVEMEG